MKRVLVKSFAVLFVLLYVVSCLNEPVVEKPEVIVPPVVEEEEKPSGPTVDDEKPYIKVGTSELVEIRNDNEH